MSLDFDFPSKETPCPKSSVATDTSPASGQNKSSTSKTNTTTANKNKKSSPKPREPKLNQKYKQSINPSKRHRDRLNSELENLAKLLPFPQDVIARLDKLSILRLTSSFLRNKNFFKAAIQKEKNETEANAKAKNFSSYFNDALDGFILVITLDGDIFFASESVKNHLGYSQSSVLHQPLETFIHDDDKDELLHYLRGKPEKIVELDENGEENLSDINGEEREFIVRLKSVLNNGSSDMFKPFKISGRIRKLEMDGDIENLKYALFAFCAPARTSVSVLEIRMKTTLFCSKNRIDLSFLDLDARGKEYFGYSKKDIFGRSSYVLVHRQDYQHLRCKHTEIMTCGKTSVGTFRLMNKNSEWTWISGYGRVSYKNGKPDFMITTNRILSDAEGTAMLKIRDQADYKALEKLGLVEPDNPSEALELGFPNRSTINSFPSTAGDDEPIPMPLADLSQHLANVSKHLASSNVNISDVFEEDKELPPQRPPSNNTHKTTNSLYSPCNSLRSEEASRQKNMSINQSPSSLTNNQDRIIKEEMDKIKMNPIDCNVSQVQRAVSISSTCESPHEYQQELSQENAMQQQFSADMFDDIPAELTTLIPQPPPQPRFSFLPPISSNTYATNNKMIPNSDHAFPPGHYVTRIGTMEQSINGNMPVAPPQYELYNNQQLFSNGPPERFPSMPFMSHLIDNFTMQQNNTNAEWIRPNSFPYFNGTASSHSSGDNHSMTSGQYQEYSSYQY